MSLPLSPRETEALRHYAAGRSGKQAAAAMGVSPNTLKTFTKALRHKLGARTVAHAVALGIHYEAIK
jgi:DNA-binding CsgD family transcriptional regulator